MKSDEEKTKEIKEIVEAVNNSEISSIKQTVTHILRAINDPKSSVRELEHIIELDPPLAAKLLKVANSAFYGYPKTISAVQEAIVCIGFEAVRELALTQKVCSLFRKEGVINGYTRSGLWKHSVAVALCSKFIFRREFRRRGENAYAAGLLHDIGIIVEDQFIHSGFTDALRKAKAERNNLDKAETAVSGFSHMDIGRAIAEDWDFPHELADTIGNHHYPVVDRDNGSRTTSAVFIANYAVQKKGIGYCDAPYQDEALFLACLSRLNIRGKAIDLIIDEVKHEMNKLEKADWF